MSLFLWLAAQSAFTVTNAVYKGPLKRPANARMVWHDEFNGTALTDAIYPGDQLKIPPKSTNTTAVTTGGSTATTGKTTTTTSAIKVAGTYTVVAGNATPEAR